MKKKLNKALLGELVTKLDEAYADADVKHSLIMKDGAKYARVICQTPKCGFQLWFAPDATKGKLTKSGKKRKVSADKAKYVFARANLKQHSLAVHYKNKNFSTDLTPMKRKVEDPEKSVQKDVPYKLSNMPTKEDEPMSLSNMPTKEDEPMSLSNMPTKEEDKPMSLSDMPTKDEEPISE